jgi:hypothetical protein
MNLLMLQSKLKLNIVGAVAWHIEAPGAKFRFMRCQHANTGNLVIYYPRSLLGCLCVCVEMLSFKKTLKTRQSRNARKEYAHATFQLGSSSDRCCGVVGIGQTPMK